MAINRTHIQFQRFKDPLSQEPMVGMRVYKNPSEHGYVKRYPLDLFEEEVVHRALDALYGKGQWILGIR